MAAIWPGYARVDAAIEIVGAATTERTTFDDGSVRQVRRFSRARARRRIVAWLTGSTENAIARTADEDLARFRAWAAACAHRRFAFPDETGSTIDVRVIGGEAGLLYSAQVSPAAARIWRIETELETL